MPRIYAFMLASVAVLAAGCSLPSYNSFGVTQEEWAQLTPEQKNLVIQGYYKYKQKQAEAKPLKDAINTLQGDIRRRDEQHHDDHRHK